MVWQAKLQLHYRRDGDRCVAHARHEGPLRVLKALYPEGPAVCHHVLVHPPGGIAGGDRIEIEAEVGPGGHALITTPGATRFYRSRGDAAGQRLHARLAEGARLEWLPAETLAYDGCLAGNALRLELAPGAETIGWEVLALGLPAAARPFASGRFEQRLELPGAWLERGCIDAADARLLDSPLGWAGRRVLATLWFAAGSALAPARRDALLDAARSHLADADPAALPAGATAPHERVVVLRVLADRVEPAMQLLKDVWAAWRVAAWALAATPPRLWRT
jgi:urease accessory protein